MDLGEINWLTIGSMAGFCGNGEQPSSCVQSTEYPEQSNIRQSGMQTALSSAN